MKALPSKGRLKRQRTLLGFLDPRPSQDAKDYDSMEVVASDDVDAKESSSSFGLLSSDPPVAPMSVDAPIIKDPTFNEEEAIASTSDEQKQFLVRKRALSIGKIPPQFILNKACILISIESDLDYSKAKESPPLANQNKSIQLRFLPL